MALQVIGAGFGRTGTLSLKLALERLGVVATICWSFASVPPMFPSGGRSPTAGRICGTRSSTDIAHRLIGRDAGSGANSRPITRMPRSS